VIGFIIPSTGHPLERRRIKKIPDGEASEDSPSTA